MNKVDPELESLVEAMLDQRIDPDRAKRLAERLREDPEARRYCAEVLRFDAAMQDELCPQEIEWTDTRRVTLRKRDGEPGLEVQRNQSVRFGKGSDGLTQPADVRSGFRYPWWPVGLLLAALVAGGLIFWSGRREAPVVKTPPLILLNPDFESTDLTFLAEPTNRALVDWQDYFVTENADVAEISRVTNGGVLPKAGRNVARLWNYAYLTQRLRRADSSPLLAEPGLSVTVSGWAYVLDGPAAADSSAVDAHPAGAEGASADPFSLRGSLRFVAGGSPGMVQYEAVNVVVPLTKGDWQPFRMEFILPDDLVLPASYGAARTKLDLAGKELTLSLDSLCKHGYQLLLDDLSIEETR